jgi:topoisomerase IA-like protein
MAPLTPEELQADIRQSDLLAEYGQAVDRESAREMLAERMGRTAAPAEPVETEERPKKERSVGRTAAKAAGAAVVGALSTSIGRTVGREIVRGLFGMLGMKPPRTRRSTRLRW